MRHPEIIRSGRSVSRLRKNASIRMDSATKQPCSEKEVA